MIVIRPQRLPSLALLSPSPRQQAELHVISLFCQPISIPLVIIAHALGIIKATYQHTNISSHTSLTYARGDQGEASRLTILLAWAALVPHERANALLSAVRAAATFVSARLDEVPALGARLGWGFGECHDEEGGDSDEEEDGSHDVGVDGVVVILEI